MELAQGDTGAALHLLLILLSFVLGAAISGCVIGHQSLKLGAGAMAWHCWPKAWPCCWRC